MTDKALHSADMFFCLEVNKDFHMNISFKLIAALFAVGVLAGCAGHQENREAEKFVLCSAAGGAITGGVAAGAITGGAGAIGGAIAGSQLALLLCTDEDTATVAVKEKAVCELEYQLGAHLDAHGCPYDSDGDGVLDGIDMCADTPAGVEVDAVGCPLDSDGDGTPDYRDLCPGTPLGVIVDSDGCPIAGAALLSLTGVNFEFNKATLTSDAEMILNEAVDLLRETDSVLEVRVEGHTDSVGSAAYNMNLSQERAQSVINYLARNGVDSTRLIPVGMGEGFPVASNETAAGRAANRRVEFVVNQ